MKFQRTGMTNNPLDLPTGDQLYYLRGGAGRPVVLLHCWGGHLGFWQDFGGLQADVDCIVPDLPGHGSSVAGPGFDGSMDCYGRSIAALVQALDLEMPMLVGHSMAGAVALEAARAMDGNVAGLVLLDTFVADYGQIPAADIETSLQGMRADFAATVQGIVSGTATEKTPPQLVDDIVADMQQGDPDILVPSWKGLLSWKPEAAFDALRCPLTFLNAASVNPDARERYARFGSERYFPESGHFLHMEDPVAFEKVLRELLSA